MIEGVIVERTNGVEWAATALERCVAVNDHNGEGICAVRDD